MKGEAGCVKSGSTGDSVGLGLGGCSVIVPDRKDRLAVCQASLSCRSPWSGRTGSSHSYYALPPQSTGRTVAQTAAVHLQLTKPHRTVECGFEFSAMPASDCEMRLWGNLHGPRERRQFW